LTVAYSQCVAVMPFRVALLGLLAAGALRAAPHPTAVLCADHDSIVAFFDTDSVKLVFVDRAILYYVDFAEQVPAIRSFDSIPHSVIAPVISPDGNWVAYAAPGSDGRLKSDLTRDVSVKSSAWICRLHHAAKPVEARRDSAHVPRFVQNSGALDIVYSTVGEDDTWEIPAGEVLRRPVSGDGIVSDSEEVVFDRFACYGGLSYDERYLATGPNRACMVDLADSSGEPSLVHRLSLRAIESDQYFIHDTITVCNPSVSSSRIFTSSMIYFDLGSAGWFRPEINGGAAWRMHELLFIARYDKTVLRSYSQPSDIPILTTAEIQEDVSKGGVGGGITLTEWDNPEWSNHPYFAASAVFADRIWNFGSGWQHTMRNEYVYAVDLKDSTFMRLVACGDTAFSSEAWLAWPWIWVKVPSGFQEDPEWLATSMSIETPRAGGALARGAVYFDRNRLVAGEPIRRVWVYDMRGRTVGMLDLGARARHSVPLHMLGLRRHGAYLIRVETLGGRRSVLRWVEPPTG